MPAGSLPKTELDKYAYLYSYDGFHRLSNRKLPGADWETFVYAKNDRPILSQDGNLRKDGKWRFSIADKSGRVCLEGVCADYILLGDNLNINEYIFAEYTGKEGNYHGDSVSKDLALVSPVFHKVNYYDNYRFLNDGLLPAALPEDSFLYVPHAGYGEKYLSAKGSLTGALTAQFGTTTGFLASAYYYDARARLIQSHETNPLNGVESEYLSYNFSGQPLSRMHVHSAAGKATLSEVYTHTYNVDTGLPLTTRHQLGNATAVLLSDKVYDALGRVSQEKRNGKAPLLTSYAYNVRSWLKGITGTPFTQSLYYNTDGANLTKCHNGNISSMTWKGSDGVTRGYKLNYDGLNRMTDAAYGETAAISTNPGRFTEKVTAYDRNGNITALQRYGQTTASAYGLTDNLTYTLTGNQLNRVDDAAASAAYNNGFEFKDGASAAGEYTYDANGNLTKDLNKGITGIQYNVLNLPSVITFSDGSTITYAYSADGTKLRTAHKIGTTITTTDYCGNVIYENGVPKHLLTQEGHVSLNDGKYHYYLKDHQGNNRVVVNQSGAVEETSHYYPFGGVFATTGNVQPYKYNGKEFDSKKGLNWYDYGARHYDAALGRFTTVNPLAEKYGEVSPYAYCLNNPINRIDPDGKQVIPIPIPTPMPLPLYYFPYQPSYSYPSDKEIVVAVNQGISNVKTSIRNGLLFWGAAAIVAYGQTKEALKPSPEYGHQRNRDRRNKEGLDQNQASIAKSIENNVTATMPSGDPMPKRDPNQWNTGAIIIVGTAFGTEIGIQATNSDPSRNAHEVRQELIQREQKKEVSPDTQQNNLFYQFINWIIK